MEKTWKMGKSMAFDNWFQAGMVVERKVSKSVPARWKIQNLPPREGLRKKITATWGPEAMCLQNVFRLLLRGYFRGGKNRKKKKKVMLPQGVRRGGKARLKPGGGSSGRAVPRSCTPTDCTYLGGKIRAQPSCGQWKLTFPISQG